ncbi:MAG: nucleotide exchange factor GrpE [Anaerolineaceae bacterium]|nr:nucleotide exchange factor GrpE [Anaerolineaceae bacterium]
MEKGRKRAEQKGQPLQAESAEITAEGKQATGSELESACREELGQMQKELEQAQQQSSEYFEGWQRERADFSNYKKRVERDRVALSHTISANIIKKYLVILDDMERALKHRPPNNEDALWVEGVELIYKKLQNILEQEGVERIPAETEEFDPNRHEAISYEESPDHESNQVIEVMEQGYMHGDRVLRPARVRVAR